MEGNTVTSGVDVPVSETRARLEEVLRRSERDLQLGLAALYIAQEEYPQLPVERYMLRLDAMAEAVKDRLDNETAPPVVLGEVIRTLFEQEGLREGLQIMIGGGVTTSELREYVGADFQTLDASAGVAYCLEQVKGA